MESTRGSVLTKKGFPLNFVKRENRERGRRRQRKNERERRRKEKQGERQRETQGEREREDGEREKERKKSERWHFTVNFCLYGCCLKTVWLCDY